MAPSCDQNQGTLPLVLTWVLLSTATAVTAARYYVRILYRNLWWDDYFALMTLVVGFIAGAFITVAITSGMGRHVNCVAPGSVITMLEFNAINEAIHVIGIGLAKISVCLCLIRVVDRARRRISQFLWFLLAFIAFTHMALALVFFLHCRPLAALWNREVKGSCYSTQIGVLMGYIGFAFDVITDIVCATIPILIIRQLQMGLRTKIALCVVMGLGVCTAVFAVIKALALRDLFAEDRTYDFTQPALWAAIEQFGGVIIISMPFLKLFFTTVLDGRFTRLCSGTFTLQKACRDVIRKFKMWKVGSVLFIKRSPSTSHSNSSGQPMTPSSADTTCSHGKPEKSTNLTANSEQDLEGSLPPPDYLGQCRVPRLADRWSAVFSVDHFSYPTSQIRDDDCV